VRFEDAACVVPVIADAQPKRAAQRLDDGVEHVRLDADFWPGVRDLHHGREDRLGIGLDTAPRGCLRKQPLA
jgi:hypothetical protein